MTKLELLWSGLIVGLSVAMYFAIYANSKQRAITQVVYKDRIVYTNDSISLEDRIREYPDSMYKANLLAVLATHEMHDDRELCDFMLPFVEMELNKLHDLTNEIPDQENQNTNKLPSRKITQL